MTDLLRDQSSGGKIGAVVASIVYSDKAKSLGVQGRDDLLNTLNGLPLEHEVPVLGPAVESPIADMQLAMEGPDMDI